MDTYGVYSCRTKRAYKGRIKTAYGNGIDPEGFVTHGIIYAVADYNTLIASYPAADEELYNKACVGGDKVYQVTEVGGTKVWTPFWTVSTGVGQVLAIPQEFGNNPVLNPLADRAYYPTVMYFASGFEIGGTPYKYICIHSSDVDSGGGLIIAGSQDFETWVQLNGGNPLVGLPAGAHHAKIIQLDTDSFRIYYWDSGVSIYQIAAIRTAVSADLINWTNDQPLQNGSNPIIVGGGGPDWNRGSYGPCDCVYNPTASNTGTNPFDYSYALYFDGTTGAFESIGLAYSADGVTFELYGLVLDHSSDTWGTPSPWDSSYVTYGKVIRTTLGKWLMFYSGGTQAAHEGLGVAMSEDGLTWEKLSTSKPLITTVAGSWREQRAYATGIVCDFVNRFDGAGEAADVKMLVSGRDAGGDYTCGYFKIPYMYADITELAYRIGQL